MKTNHVALIFTSLIICSQEARVNKNKENIQEILVRNTSSGLVKGEIRKSKYGNDEQYYAFHAIPYGMPPINSLRFMAPKPSEPWSGIYDASDPNSYRCCTQVNHKRYSYHYKIFPFKFPITLTNFKFIA